MQRLCLSLLVAALVLPAAALAVDLTPRDGTLVVRNADGKVAIWKANGTVFGRLSQGKLTIDDSNPGDADEPEVFGAEQTIYSSDDDGLVTYVGKGIRFRFFGGGYSIRIQGTGINLSAVGHGTAKLQGIGVPTDGDYGDYAVNGGKFVPVTFYTVTVVFPPATPTTP